MKNWKTKFVLLGVGQAVSMLTSSILQISIVWYLTQKTLSPTIVTLSTLAGYLPRAVLGLFTGVFIDRFDRKKILVFADLIIALAALVLAAVALSGDIPIWLIFAMLCLRSVGAAFHTPAFNAVVPTLVPKEALTRCAGITQGFESVSLILSPALAALLFKLWDLSAIILLDVVGAAVAIIIVILLPIARYATAQEERVSLHIWKDTKEGFAVLRRVPGLMAVMIISTVYAFIYFPIGSMYPLITMAYFGGGVAESGMVEIAFSSGTLLGSFLLGLMGNKIRKLGGITASIGIYGLGLMAAGLLPPDGLRPFILLSILMGLTLPFFYGLRTAILQSNVPGDYLGRVLSLAYSVSLFASPLGLLFGGTVSELMGVNICFFIGGVLSVCLAATMLLTPSVRKSHL
ncbi:MFS transporter [Kineothrix sp. MB12-C1]|uniref:MFS transporter n=1 Tax=Kineothrix sp. MB12-C1 TaxID=3070215 RepID=UPI0027D22DF9|nr:MFS transporter [Kineothrix sp. MB12-C1]WMC92578.1 MFS transporter [Kineothrix sp. MB12-C1]